MTVRNGSAYAKITDYDLALRGVSLRSPDNPLALARVCSQLHHEAKDLPIRYCPLIAFIENAACFLRYRKATFIRHMTMVIALKKGNTLNIYEEVCLAEIKSRLKDEGASTTVHIDVRLPDDSPWE